MKIAILMTCYNRVDTTIVCLRQLFLQTIPEGASFDIWLVDDGSPDETGVRVKSEYPQVNVIKSPGNLYWCRGMRLAWEAAAKSYDYDAYLWLNDDVMLYDFALLTVLADYKATGEMSVIIGAFHQKLGGNEISYGVSASSGGKVVPQGKVIQTNGFMSGNFVFVPRGVFKRVGPIYGGYYHAYGDYDYGMMLTRAGIPQYCSSSVLGVCPQQADRYLHFEGRNVFQRLKLLYEPKGYCLHDAVLFKYRNWGCVRAILTGLHVVFKVLLAKR